MAAPVFFFPLRRDGSRWLSSTSRLAPPAPPPHTSRPPTVKTASPLRPSPPPSSSDPPRAASPRPARSALPPSHRRAGHVHTRALKPGTHRSLPRRWGQGERQPPPILTPPSDQLSPPPPPLPPSPSSCGSGHTCGCRWPTRLCRGKGRRRGALHGGGGEPAVTPPPLWPLSPSFTRRRSPPLRPPRWWGQRSRGSFRLVPPWGESVPLPPNGGDKPAGVSPQHLQGRPHPPHSPRLSSRKPPRRRVEGGWQRANLAGRGGWAEGAGSGGPIWEGR